MLQLYVMFLSDLEQLSVQLRSLDGIGSGADLANAANRAYLAVNGGGPVN